MQGQESIKTPQSKKRLRTQTRTKVASSLAARLKHLKTSADIPVYLPVADVFFTVRAIISCFVCRPQITCQRINCMHEKIAVSLKCP